MRVQLIKFLAGIVFAVFVGSTVFSQTPEMVRHFDYDKIAPIDLKIAGTEKRGDVTVNDITYASPKGGVVPAYLVVPSGIAFLVEQLKLKPVPANVVAAVPEFYQPPRPTN